MARFDKLLLLCCIWLGGLTAGEPEAFLESHCFDCHDGDTRKGGLDLTALKADWQSAQSAATWERVFDRVNDGLMPPKKYEQPAAAERSAFLEKVRVQLHAASAARQQANGRVVLRRMNRREYEATIHDLLGIAEPLQHLLPEDNPIHGFDTISKGLETSATHLLRYQQAADVALEAALPRLPLQNSTVRVTGKKYLEGRLPVHRKGIDPFVRVEGEALVLHARLYGDNSMQAPHPVTPGRYRIRASLRLVNNDSKPMPVLIGKRVDRFQAEKLMHIVDIQDVPAEGTKVVEVETDLKYSQGNQFIYFEGTTLPWFQDFEKKRGEAGKSPLNTDFNGPGLVIEWAELEGPLNVEVGYQRLFGDLPRLPRMPDGKKPPENWKSWPLRGGEFQRSPLMPVSTDPKGDANRLLRAFLPLAFRRPVAEDLAAHYVKFAHTLIDQGEPFDEALRAAYKAVLCAPYFLTYIEPPGKLDDYALASRLARFLWSSAPDEPLYAAAASGTLSKPEVLRAQTERMLNDPRAKRFSRSFTDQWLDLGKFLDMKPDDLYVEYDETLAWSMPLETRRFFDEVLAKNLPATAFFHSDWTMLNARLAKHYGIAGVEGMEFRKVAVPAESHRGGVITHGSVLKLTTNASYTSPIKRGAWLLERMIGKPPPPPPPDVKAVEPDIRGATTIREQLEKHKNVAACAACHIHIDPPGFALESFDVVGGWRDAYRVKQGGLKHVELANYPGRKVWLAKPVQADGETYAGARFKDISEYKQLVLKDPDPLTRNLATKLILYSTGAEIAFADRAGLEKIVGEVKAGNHGFRALLHAVIQSPIFQQK